jgi:APA family basic amino acid/polyamine antiporter
MVRLRRRAGWTLLPAVSWGYPLIPAIFIVASVWMLFYTAALRPRESFLGLLTMLVGGLAYRWIR